MEKLLRKIILILGFKSKVLHLKIVCISETFTSFLESILIYTLPHLTSRYLFCCLLLCLFIIVLNLPIPWNHTEENTSPMHVRSYIIQKCFVILKLYDLPSLELRGWGQPLYCSPIASSLLLSNLQLAGLQVNQVFLCCC